MASFIGGLLCAVTSYGNLQFLWKPSVLMETFRAALKLRH